MQESLTATSYTARAWQIAELHKNTPKLVVVLPENQQLEPLGENLRFFCAGEQIIELPACGTLPFEHVSAALPISAQRIQALWHLHHGSKWILLTPLENLTQLLAPAATLFNLAFTILKGATHSREELALQLQRCSFNFVSRVQTLGEAAVRGEVVDFFPSTTTTPIRIEFFDDRIERIRQFDTHTQRSTNEVDQVLVLPLREYIDTANNPNLCTEFAHGLEKLTQRANQLGLPLRLREALLNQIVEGAFFPGQENLLSLFFKLTPLSSYYSQNGDPHTLVVDPVLVSLKLDQFYEEIASRSQRYIREQAFFVEPSDLYRDQREVARSLITDDATLTELEQSPIRPNTELVFNLTHKHSQQGFKPLKQFIIDRLAEQHRVALVLPTPSRREQVRQILLQHDIKAYEVADSFQNWRNLPLGRASVATLTGSISSGFQHRDERFTLISEQDLFSTRSQRTTKAISTAKQIHSSLSQLQEDALVVHIDYGIGRYRGLTNKVIEDVAGDFLEIEYADSTLLLPVQLIGKISRYSAPSETQPKLDKLGSTRWMQTKQKVKEAVSTLAGDLVRLYAKRAATTGWRFEPYGAEDERFAETFPYNETEDQLKAIEETLSDMAASRPMDRLICGDVGFGKTEVALRAAFKATQHLKQVALLTPTTVLAEQHGKTFRERFKEYPVKVGVVSRFYSAAENKQTLKLVSRGEIDIVIGTHRLLSRDIRFADLGLLIIDEEHRFGVKHKEKLKSIKADIDVLNLTATPIPRTLHMSLIGIRDVSVIATPPPRRQVIKTFVARPEEAIIRDAILREVNRGGQVFFLYNKVTGIETMVQQIEQLVPEARVNYGHGQMREAQLELVMRDFILRKFDVLVSTTIVESGIDIPSANTIIIYDAQNYGLAQLYQLRGRVGRGNQQAYAYLLTPEPRTLSSTARERIKIFANMSDLGVGFQLALRDLEVRGSGNLLGRQQSGHVFSVGFDLYTKILKQALEHLKGHEFDVFETLDPEINLGVQAFIPGYYIPDVSERLILYQRLAGLSDPKEAIALTEEIEDRFGSIPSVTQDLIKVMKLRALLRVYGVAKLERKNSADILLSLSAQSPFDLQAILDLKKRGITLSKNLTLRCHGWMAGNFDLDQLTQDIEKLLKSITRVS